MLCSCASRRLNAIVSERIAGVPAEVGGAGSVNQLKQAVVSKGAGMQGFVATSYLAFEAIHAMLLKLGLTCPSAPIPEPRS